jgi:hypothetical protein
MIGRSLAERRRMMMENGNLNVGGRQYAGQMFIIRMGPNGQQIISVGSLPDMTNEEGRRNINDNIHSDSSSEE